jgi:hypothetical protein
VIPRWKSEHQQIVDKLVGRYLNTTSNLRDIRYDVVRQTGALPLYGDLGGIILLTSSGKLILYENADGKVGELHDESWQKTALVVLARDYPELAELGPVRPDHASDCPCCHGAGRVTKFRIICGECGGTGWKSRSGHA